MCDDLIAKHYRHSEPSFIVHKSPEGTTHFTLYPSKKVWLIQHPTCKLLTKDLDELRPRWSTFNSYDPSIVLWARENRFEVHQLREMKLAMTPETTLLTPPGSADGPNPTTTATTTRDADKEGQLAFSVAPPKGYRQAPALSTKNWYLAAYPHHSNIVHEAGEQVFSILDASRSIPRRAGWITVLPDAATRRVYISSLEVAPEHRRRGLASWLVCAVARWWGVQGGEVWLTVFEENEPAVKLYESLGFEEVKKLWVVTRRQRRESIIDEDCG